MTHIPPAPPVHVNRLGSHRAETRSSHLAELLAFKPATAGALTGKIRHDLGDDAYEASLARGRAARSERARRPLKADADRALFATLATRARSTLYARGEDCSEQTAEQLAEWAWDTAERHGRRPILLDVDAAIIDHRSLDPLEHRRATP